MTRCWESVKEGEGQGEQADKNKKAALRINTEEVPKNVHRQTQIKVQNNRKVRKDR